MNVRFVISWIVSAVGMYTAFYLWHGVFSNDFYKIQYPKGIFLSLAAIVYIGISFLLSKLFEVKKIKSKIKHLYLKAIVIGLSLGFMLFALALVLGLGFSANYTFSLLVLDFSWQLIEQLIGAMLVAVVHTFVFVPEFEEEKH